MKLLDTGLAGTLESGDILIEIKPSDAAGINISLESIVENQFGQQIKRVIYDTVCAYNLENIEIRAVDKGALDCTIRARVTTAVLRGLHTDDFKW